MPGFGMSSKTICASPGLETVSPPCKFEETGGGGGVVVAAACQTVQVHRNANEFCPREAVDYCPVAIVRLTVHL